MDFPRNPVVRPMDSQDDQEQKNWNLLEEETEVRLEEETEVRLEEEAEGHQEGHLDEMKAEVTEVRQEEEVEELHVEEVDYRNLVE